MPPSKRRRASQKARPEPSVNEDHSASETESHPSKRLRFSQPLETGNDAQDAQDNAPASASKVPSSSAPAATSKKPRHSLPARLPSHESHRALVDQVQFAPLRDVIDSRQRRRLRRSHLSEELNIIQEHDRVDTKREKELRRLREDMKRKDEQIKQLNLELEERRLMGIEISIEDDDRNNRVKELEVEVAQMREALGPTPTPLPETPGLDDDDDEDDCVFINPDDIGVSRESMVTKTRFVPATVSPVPRGTVVVPDPAFETQIQEFETHIASLTHNLAEKHTLLDVLSIEVEHLGFPADSSDPKDILAAVRNAFRRTRLEFQELLPEQGQDIVALDNDQVLQTVMDNIRALLEQIDASTKLVNNYRERVTLLQSQYNGVLDQLSELDGDKAALDSELENLRTERDKLVKDLADSEGYVEDLIKQVKAHEQTVEAMQETIDARDETVAAQKAHIDQKNAENTKRYHDLVELRDLIDKLDQEHADKVEALQTQKASAEATIASLASQVTTLQNELQRTTQSMQDVIDAKDVTILQRDDTIKNLRDEAAAAEQENNDLIQDHVDEVGRLDSEIAELTDAVATRDDNVESLGQELRAQAVNYQTEVEGRDARIDELGAELADAYARTSDLEKQNQSLSDRVEHEASQMLEFQVHSEDKLSDLRKQVRQTQAALDDTKVAAAAKQAQLVAEISARDILVADADAAILAHKQTIDALTTTNTDLRSRLRRLATLFNENVNHASANVAASDEVVTTALQNLRACRAAVEVRSREDMREVEDLIAGVVDGPTDVLTPPATERLTPVSATEGQVVPLQGGSGLGPGQQVHGEQVVITTKETTKVRRSLRRRAGGPAADSGIGLGDEDEEVDRGERPMQQVVL